MNDQKEQIRDFLDMAAAYLSGGYLMEKTDRYVYNRNIQPSFIAGISAEKSAGSESAPQSDKFTHDVETLKSQSDIHQQNLPDTLEKIALEVHSCHACRLCEERKNAVPGEGVPRPLVLVAGEGPGADEDQTGRPFVGRAGQLLDKMLASIGLSREKNCFIANIVKCRPPRNRDPSPDEIAACAGFIQRQIKLLKPLVVLSAGRISASALLQTTVQITRIRGIWKEYCGIPLLPVFHPSYLLRDESQKTLAWEDMKSLCRHLVDLNEDYKNETSELRAARNI